VWLAYNDSEREMPLWVFCEGKITKPSKTFGSRKGQKRVNFSIGKDFAITGKLY